MKTGTVKFFNESKGYGFIKDDEDEKEYFVHVSGLIDRIKDNDKVIMTCYRGDNPNHAQKSVIPDPFNKLVSERIEGKIKCHDGQSYGINRYIVDFDCSVISDKITSTHCVFENELEIASISDWRSEMINGC